MDIETLKRHDPYLVKNYILDKVLKDKDLVKWANCVEEHSKLTPQSKLYL